MQEIQETQAQAVGGEDPLEEGMATHSSVVAWRIPRTEEPGGLQSMESQSVGQDWAHIHGEYHHSFMAVCLDQSYILHFSHLDSRSYLRISSPLYGAQELLGYFEHMPWEYDEFCETISESICLNTILQLLLV